MSGFQPINTYYLFNFFQPMMAIKSIPRDFFVALFSKNCQPLRAQKGWQKEKQQRFKRQLCRRRIEGASLWFCYTKTLSDSRLQENSLPAPGGRTEKKQGIKSKEADAWKL